MSKFSGKCDFYDHIFAGQKENETEIDMFNKFKKESGGKFEVNMFRNDFRSSCDVDSFIKLHPSVDLKIETANSGKRKKTYYVYRAKTFKSIRALNKNGVHYRRTVKFDTLLDLVHYFPYIVAASCGGYVVLSKESYVETEIKLNTIWTNENEEPYAERYNKELAKECARIAKILDPTLGFDSKEDAKCWYLLQFGNDAEK